MTDRYENILLHIAQQQIITARGILLALGYKKFYAEEDMDLSDLIIILEETMERLIDDR
jgi:hypothetical protein